MRGRIPAVALLLLLSFGSLARSWAYLPPQKLVGVVSEIDVVGTGMEVRTREASAKTRRLWFVVPNRTVILPGGLAGSLADLYVGEEVRVTYFPARIPHIAARVEVR